ncbi:nitroreductase family deazaflavin-dependent oxidoreductase [Dermatophilaceae bacterium Soc4.6]
MSRYVAPTVATLRFNSLVAWLTRHGLSIMGSRVLTVRGRTTGTPRSTPVNLLTLDEERYLVSPRGHSQWVRNARVAGEVELRVGRRVEQVSLTEVPVPERVAVIREYLRKWGWEVGQFVEGLTARSDDARILEVAPDFPVFRLAPRV